MISIARPLLGTDEETFNINPDAIIEKITPILEIIINIIKEVELS